MAHRAAALRYEDLEAFPEDNTRREIIDGELFVSPSPSLRHQEIVASLWAAFHAYGRTHDGKAYVGPVDVLLAEHDVVAPDVIYIAADRATILQEKAIFGAPSLIVEVTSSNRSRDRGKKLRLYARSGIPEYWIVDPKHPSIERCSDPVGECYANVQIFTETMNAATLPDLRIVIPELVD
ncbi:MAG TPA: Uma2 family endonuclease [Candidatus Baltobacteraceae bacterium]|jgi:Uma2 family endonuclease